ncbi:MAG: hypothetical protein V3V93_02845, partial [bacterium]
RPNDGYLSSCHGMHASLCSEHLPLSHPRIYNSQNLLIKKVRKAGLAALDEKVLVRRRCRTV